MVDSCTCAVAVLGQPHSSFLPLVWPTPRAAHAHAARACLSYLQHLAPKYTRFSAQKQDASAAAGAAEADAAKAEGGQWDVHGSMGHRACSLINGRTGVQAKAECGQEAAMSLTASLVAMNEAATREAEQGAVLVGGSTIWATCA